MRTFINVVLILVAAVAIGLVMRSRLNSEAENSPPQLGVSRAGERIKPMVPAEPVEGWLTEFELTERSGRTVSSNELKGEPYVASFFFSTCPSICKLQNEKMQQLQTEFLGQPVKFVAITVDPEVDTPEVLREYAKRYKADENQWLFLTGDLDYIRQVASMMYMVAANKANHTEKFMLMDADGTMIDYYSWSEPEEFKKLSQDIKQLVGSDTEQVEPFSMGWLALNLPHATASLNALATLLLLLALAMIKQGNIKAHRNLMLTALVVSSVFLGLYLLHKVALYETTGSYNKAFPRDPAVASSTARTIYFIVLATHVPLAITVPVLAIWAAVLGLRDRREAHKKLVRFAYPIWLYVSITGVVVYWMLYQAYAVKA